MSVDSLASSMSFAVQAQASQQVPQSEGTAAVSVAGAGQVDPKQIGADQGGKTSSDAARQAVTAAHLGVHVDEEA